MQIFLFQVPTVYLIVGAVLAAIVIAGVFRLALKRRPRRAASAKIQVSSEKLKSDIILSAIEDGVLVVTPDKTIQVFNPGAAKITGWPDTEAVGLDHHLVIKLVTERGEELDQSLNPLDIVFITKSNARNDSLLLSTRSQKRIAIGLAVSPLFDGEQISGAVAIFRDISKEVKEQQQRAEFISTASHEMRTPVAAIEGYLSLALNPNVSKVDAKAKEYLEKAHASTEHLGKLFQNLLTSAKAEDGRLASHPSVVEMGAFIEQLTDSLRFAAQKKGLLTEFIVGTPDSTIDARQSSAKVISPLYYVYVDPDRMQEVITNLFDNAVKYTESGKISLGITGDAKIVQIRVADSGPGITPEDLPHLFDKFYRVDSSATRSIGGTGLGLFICRKIVELYSGHIWVDSTPGKGSIFYVNLPRVASQDAAAKQAATVAPASPLK